MELNGTVRYNIYSTRGKRQKSIQVTLELTIGGPVGVCHETYILSVRCVLSFRTARVFIANQIYFAWLYILRAPNKDGC